MKALMITPLLQSQIDRVLRATELYPNADDGYGPLEQEQLALAEEFMRAYAQQAHRLDRLPRARPAKAGPSPVVDVELRRKRRAG